jgi:hypothetical protein
VESTGLNPLDLRGDARGEPTGCAAKKHERLGGWKGGPAGIFLRLRGSCARGAQDRKKCEDRPCPESGRAGFRGHRARARPRVITGTVPLAGAGQLPCKVAQGRGGGQGAASPDSSTRTLVCAGPRQMLPAMTRPGSHGYAARAASLVKTAGEGGGTSGTAAGKPSSLMGMTGACGVRPRPGRRWRRTRRSWRGFECRDSFKLRCSMTTLGWAHAPLGRRPGSR